MKHFVEFLKYQPPGRLITTGFAVVILLGAFLLLLPCSVKDGAEVSVIDALFTSTSAVCVTGLIAIDTADHFTALGCRLHPRHNPAPPRPHPGKIHRTASFYSFLIFRFDLETGEILCEGIIKEDPFISSNPKSLI